MIPTFFLKIPYIDIEKQMWLNQREGYYEKEWSYGLLIVVLLMGKSDSLKRKR